jgi:glutamyl-tRNA synthetase
MSVSKPIVTRFAPSPTGMLHIGGARTALFNWVLAKAMGGQFLLRIEDTDKTRSTDEARAAILDGLQWLGLEWDGEPLYQSTRADRHAEIADQLLQSGAAYRDYSTQEERAAQAQALKSGNRQVSLWRDHEGPAPALPYSLRLRAPLDGDTVIHDSVQGEIRFANSELDDLVLLRSDGSPTYMLAVVVDDHDMGVTHIVRGDDHLTNAARQALIWKALGWELPQFAHIPLIHGEDGKKLSKRHGAVGAAEFRDAGYLPEALRNYLLRLGWAHGDMEFFTDAQAREVFSLDGISKGAAQLDYAKLDSVNEWHLRALAPSDLAKRCLPWLEAAYGAERIGAYARLESLLSALVARMTRLDDAVSQTRFVFAPDALSLDGKATKPLRKADPILVKQFIMRLEGLSLSDWNAEGLGSFISEFLKEQDLGFGALGGPVRAALCRGAPAPDLSQTLDLIGRDESLARLNNALTLLGSSATDPV